MDVKTYLRWLASTLLGVVTLCLSIAILSFAIGLAFKIAVICYRFAYNLW